VKKGNALNLNYILKGNVLNNIREFVTWSFYAMSTCP